MPPFKSAFSFCEWVEQELGWEVPSETSEIRRKALIVECAKVKRRMATNPEQYSWDNLAVTVAWLKDKRKTVTPWGVLGWVQVALKETRRRPSARPTDIAVAIAQAIEREQSQRREDWEFWVRRLTRAQGDGREDVYTEWEQQRENS